MYVQMRKGSSMNKDFVGRLTIMMVNIKEVH